MPLATAPRRTVNGHPKERVQAPLESYLREINETPLLKPEEEAELAYRISDGDCEARDHLVRANLRLVVNIARTFPSKGLALQDLIAEGNLGLMRAAEAFDPSLNTRFSTYASYWIKQSMRRAVQNMAKVVRLPAYMNQLLVEWRRASAKLQNELDRPPTDEEVARSLHLSQKKIKIIKKAIRIYQGVQQSEQNDTHSLNETVSENLESPESHLVRADEMQQVLELLNDLEPREAEVLRLRFGLTGENPKTLTEIGQILHLTRERVRQIEKEALRKLHEKLEEE